MNCFLCGRPDPDHPVEFNPLNIEREPIRVALCDACLKRAEEFISKPPAAARPFVWALGNGRRSK